MKTRLLSGLTALLLGGLTSCSNILEENGVINNVAESGMGELRINLTTDANLNALTKSDSNPSTTTTKVKEILETVPTNGFTIKGTGTNPNNQFTGTVGQYTTAQKVPADTYSITAENSYPEGFRVDFGKPHFKGTISDITVTANQTKTVDESDFIVTLQNSVITVNPNINNTTESTFSITDLYIVDPNNSSTSYSLLTENKTAIKIPEKVDELLFVDPAVEYVNIVIKGTVNQKKFDITKPINTKQESSSNTPKNYYVNYTLSTNNGDLVLNVSVDGSVTEASQNFTIDPYNGNSSSNKSANL